MLYRRFDAVFALSENGGAAKLRRLGVDSVDVVPLGVELGEFGPGRRDPRLRRKLGLEDGQPLLVYVGRLDGEKKPDVVAEAFRRLPRSLGAKVALIGEGPLRSEIATLGDDRIVMPGYMKNRAELASWLASADIYVSGMADETFGVSILEAQASGLPVVGVAAGAMIDRVTDKVGRPGWRRRSDGFQHPRGMEFRPNRDGRGGAGARAGIQLGQQHGSPVRPPLSGRVRPTRWAADSRARGGRTRRLTGSTAVHA